MIVVRLAGGLGNQMFQYACGLSLSNQIGTPLYLDTTLYRQNKFSTPRKLELDIFDTNIKLASRNELALFYPPSNTLLRQWWKLQRINTPSLIIDEESIHYEKIVHKGIKNVLLKGYWQSYRYFENMSEDIRVSFRFRQKPNQTNKYYLEKINDSNSIAIHIRRGDYVSDERTNQFHGVCPPAYYHQAIAYIRKCLAQPKFFFFSDDPRWAQNAFGGIKGAEFIHHNTKQISCEDLRLMTACKHIIIANSTFSWWAAWLNSYENKIVIAPKQWFASGEQAQDLILPSWIRL